MHEDGEQGPQYRTRAQRRRAEAAEGSADRDPVVPRHSTGRHLSGHAAPPRREDVPARPSTAPAQSAHATEPVGASAAGTAQAATADPAAAQTKSLAKSSAIMAAGTLVSRVLGLVKTMLLLTAIGVTVGGTADAFDVANKIPNNLYMLLAGGVLNAVLVPQIVRATKQPDGGRDFTNRLLTLSITLLLIFTGLATLCAPALIWLYSGGWPAEQTALAVAFGYWCLPQIFFYGLYTLLGQVLNAKGSFGPYMWAPVLNNVVAIAGLGLFILFFGPGEAGQHAVGTWNAGKIALLAGSATLGVVAQALILVFPLKRIGFRFRPTWGFRGVGLGTAGKVAGWTFAAVLIGQLGFVFISRTAAGATSVGGQMSAGNAAYTSSYTIFMLPHSLVAVSLATALFTSLSRYAADRDVAAVRGSYSQGMRLVGLVNVFFTSALVALGTPTAALIAGGSTAQARTLGLIVAVMILGLVPFSANYLTQRVFYAYEDARTPFWIQLVQVAVTTLGLLVVERFGTQYVVAGIGAAMALGYTVACVLSLWLLHRKIGSIDLWRIVWSHVRFAIAGVVALVVGRVLLIAVGESAYAGRVHSFISVAWMGVVMLLVYLVACRLLRVREVTALTQAVRTKLGR